MHGARLPQMIPTAKCVHIDYLAKQGGKYVRIQKTAGTQICERIESDVQVRLLREILQRKYIPMY